MTEASQLNNERERRKCLRRRVVAVSAALMPIVILIVEFYDRYTSQYAFPFIKRRQPVTVQEALQGLADSAISVEFLPIWLVVVMGVLIWFRPRMPYGMLLLAISSAYPLCMLVFVLFFMRF